MADNDMDVGTPEDWVHESYKLQTWMNVYFYKIGKPPTKRKTSKGEIEMVKGFPTKLADSSESAQRDTIPSERMLSQHVPSQPMPSQTMPSQPVPSQIVPSQLVPTQLRSFPSVLSQVVSSQVVAS
ncbi:hypothetical protein Tco_1502689 [Tanacetum coccineum]